MEKISVFDIFKIGIGPSSSHTVGPWRAAGRFLHYFKNENSLEDITSLKLEFFGSLAKTGRGHESDIAGIMGLTGANVPRDHELTPSETIPTLTEGHQAHFHSNPQV